MRGGEGGIRTLEAGISRLRDFQSRSFGQLGHLSVNDNHQKIQVPKNMAEREGFEPSVRFYPYNRLAGGCLQPYSATSPDPSNHSWRREQDSNLRGVAAQRFSRPPPSAARPSLHETCIYTRSGRREGAKKGSGTASNTDGMIANPAELQACFPEKAESACISAILRRRCWSGRRTGWATR